MFYFLGGIINHPAIGVSRAGWEDYELSWAVIDFLAKKREQCPVHPKSLIHEGFVNKWKVQL